MKFGQTFFWVIYTFKFKFQPMPACLVNIAFTHSGQWTVCFVLHRKWVKGNVPTKCIAVNQSMRENIVSSKVFPCNYSNNSNFFSTYSLSFSLNSGVRPWAQPFSWQLGSCSELPTTNILTVKLYLIQLDEPARVLSTRLYPAKKVGLKKA